METVRKYLTGYNRITYYILMVIRCFYYLLDKGRGLPDRSARSGVIANLIVVVVGCLTASLSPIIRSQIWK